jgi:hypothetical protein
MARFQLGGNPSSAELTKLNQPLNADLIFRTS